MDLADFIDSNIQILVDDWAEYAVSISPEESQLSEEQLRNSASDILTAIAADMREPQNAAEQQSKSRGKIEAPRSCFNYVARLHAEDRLSHAFGINDVVAEFRALRATVLRRWQKAGPEGAMAFQQMIRFNEAIDQVLAESVRHYVQRTERIRDLFAGVLAHDLRSPLGAILNFGEILFRDEGLSPTSTKALAHIQRGAMRMRQMLEDLLIFTRTRLGDTLPISLTPQNMGRICRDAVDEVRASHLDALIDLRFEGDLRGRWDGGRIGQLIVTCWQTQFAMVRGRLSLRLALTTDR
ncbi:histidine kinase dimerization/phospho-acceptor domain-containing protein [Paraburkholderia sp. SIMBA_009]